MNKITGNEPARPADIAEPVDFHGLTIRQHFAAMALQGMLSNSTASIKDMLNPSDAYLYAKDSVMFADALIAELNKTAE